MRYSFLEAVRRKLSDLPVPDQSDLLDQVEQRLHDLDASGEPRAIQARLGQAADMAADLRAAAGFAPAIVLGLMTERFDAPVRLLVTALNFVTVALLIAYPTWWLAPAFASYSGLVNW